ncbi:MAG: glycosyltransferase family 4 protein [Pontiella sp.]
MKIGIVTTWFERGAAYVSRQYRDVLEPDHEVYIYARGGENYAIGDPKWDFEGVHWGKQSLQTDSSGLDMKDFKSWLKNTGVDCVLFNEQQTWWAVLACREMGVKTVAYVDYYTEPVVPLFSFYDVLICNTERHYSVFNWHPGAHYIPWGTNTDVFKPQHQDGRLVDEKCVTFFHSTGMSPSRKGTDLVVRAFSALNCENVRLVLHTQVSLEPDLGGGFLGHHGEFSDECRDLLDKLVKEGKAEVVHKTVGAPGLFHLGDVYLYPARLDGIGLTVCEALACGLPAVVPDNGPMNEFVPSDKVGRRIPVVRYVSRYDGYYWPQCSVDLEALSAVMQWFVDNREKVPEMKKASRKYAVENREWSLCKNQLVAVFEGIKPVVFPERSEQVSQAKRFKEQKLNRSRWLRHLGLVNLYRLRGKMDWCGNLRR